MVRSPVQNKYVPTAQLQLRLPSQSSLLPEAVDEFSNYPTRTHNLSTAHWGTTQPNEQNIYK